MKIRVMFLLFLAALSSGTAFGHHAFSMFDQKKQVLLEGEIKEFQWANPHVWVQILVKGADGKVVEWSIEGSSPNGLRRQGWSSKSLLPGMKVKLMANPLKSGENGGSLINVTLEDGTLLGRKIDPND
jgi:hypothetical protein